MPSRVSVVRFPSSAASMEPGPQYSTGGLPAKYPNDARKLPASCQDWWGLLRYTPCDTDQGGRGQRTGGALCVASTLRARAQVEGQYGQHRHGMAEQGVVGRACTGLPWGVACRLLLERPHARLCAPSFKG
jgi:hypothetical protein